MIIIKYIFIINIYLTFYRKLKLLIFFHVYALYDLKMLSVTLFSVINVLFLKINTYLYFNTNVYYINKLFLKIYFQ